MRAVRLYGVGDLRVEEVPPPAALEPGWARLKVLAAGICGSDLHNFRTGQWISRTPSTPGHELCGEITGVGAGVEGLAVGDRVIADSRFWCGACAACRAGRPNLCETLGYIGEVCDSGFAEELALPARLLHKLPSGLDPIVAATAEPLAVALHAVNRLAARPGEPVLVVGCGPIGGLAALALAQGGRNPVLVADRNPARLELVASVTGATRVTLERHTVAATAGGAPLRHAIEATGSVVALAATLDLVANGGTLALVGIFHGRLDLDPNLLVEREINLRGCSAFAGELPDAIALLPELAPSIRRLIEAEIGLADVPAAYARLIQGDSAGLKTIVRPAMQTEARHPRA
jgi:(R,R)-butanediol dehydrogenase / meso-butanediol dehydrogenase / diacetyl reductase